MVRQWQTTAYKSSGGTVNDTDAITTESGLVVGGDSLDDIDLAE
jgi:hypothetical protein